MTTPRPSRVSWVLLVAVVAALAVGAAASILVRPAAAPARASGPVALVYLPAWVIALACIGILGFFALGLIVMRLAAGRSTGQSQFAVRVLMAILVAIVFLLAVRQFVSGSSTSGGGNSTTQNATGPPPPPPPSPGPNVTGSGGVIVWPGVPPWLPFVILAAVAVAVVLVAAPGVRIYLEERRGGKPTGPNPDEVAPVRAALAQAAAELDEGRDPRDVILGLYGAMLARLRPMAVGLDVSTPEEIRAVHLERLGVRPTSARTLTRLFEEARYSEHPMGRESSQAAQAAVREVLDDLDRREIPS